MKTRSRSTIKPPKKMVTGTLQIDFLKRRPKDGKSTKETDALSLKSKEEETALFEQSFQETELDVIVGRQQQQEAIYEFMKDCLLGKINSKTLYVSGVPGVGKTMTTIKTMRQFANNCKNIIAIELNAMAFKNPKSIYEVIYHHIEAYEKPKGSKVKKSLLGVQLQKLLKTAKNHYFFLIDEVDYLMTKDQAVYYNLFDWAFTYQKFSLIIIANTMNFPQKLSEKICSRLGRNRLVFKPYAQKQILEIVEARVSSQAIYQKKAMNFAVKKMASFTSDLRKIFDVLKRVQQQRGGNKITLGLISQIWSQFAEENDSWQQHLPPNYITILNVIKQLGGKTDSKQLLIRLVNSHCNFTRSQLEHALLEMRDMGLLKIDTINKLSLEVMSLTLLKF